MAAPNIINASTIILQTAVLDVTTSATAIASNTGGSNKVFKLNGLIVSNRMHLHLIRLLPKFIQQVVRLMPVILLFKFRYLQSHHLIFFQSHFICKKVMH
jgi:hypothetical protein